MVITKRRYHLLDSIRGATLVSMVLYHAVWDLVYLFGFDWAWYRGGIASLWQQSICWVFIFLSGFCWKLGRNPLKRGLLVFFAGGVISVVTALFMPESPVLFGILTLLGACSLLMIPLDQLSQKLPSPVGLTVCVLLFGLTRSVQRGVLGFFAWEFWNLPAGLYQGKVATFLGFPEQGFFSVDYFPLIPWLFLFAAGYFTYRLLQERELMSSLFERGFAPLNFIGKHSLLIYMLHQPILYLCLSVFLYKAPPPM